jgi:late competence protein required for DNA uptake (superfamily II DNA/RNA helicase)
MILKATGLGITELTLRYMVYLATKDNQLRNSTMCIVTGPRIDLAENLIQRIKNLFGRNISASSNEITTLPETRSTIAQVNGVNIVAFPSHHLSSMRGLENVSFIFLDEADFFPPGQQMVVGRHCLSNSAEYTTLKIEVMRLPGICAFI